VHVWVVDLVNLKEIRTGDVAVRTKDFKTATDASKIKPKLAIAFMYGEEFRLKALCLVGSFINASQQTWLKHRRRVISSLRCLLLTCCSCCLAAETKEAFQAWTEGLLPYTRSHDEHRVGKYWTCVSN
jgi:hypothetical protein